jgi:glucose-6-phosphate 1-dehydrogenase
MEAPARGESYRAETARVLRAIVPLDPANIVRGQYAGYRQEPRVSPSSNVETFAAARLSIDSWRWAGVPFYLRAGKCLAADATEVWVELYGPPRSTFDEQPCGLCNYVRFGLGPDVSIALGVKAKAPGERMVGESVELLPTRWSGPRMLPYQRLLGDAMRGDPLLFANAETVEAQWRVVDPVLGDVTPVHLYAPGSWGPPTVSEQLVPPLGWRNVAPKSGAIGV